MTEPPDLYAIHLSHWLIAREIDARKWLFTFLMRGKFWPDAAALWRLKMIRRVVAPMPHYLKFVDTAIAGLSPLAREMLDD